jgi:hypothetical protein
VAWSLFVFALRDRWALAVFSFGTLLFALVERPRIGGSHRLVDGALSCCLALVAVQLIPVPAALRFALSPASLGIDRALLLVTPANPSQGAWHPLTLDPDASAWALLLAASVLVFFWSARTMFERSGGLRTSVRGTVWIGLALSVVTFAQHHLSPHLFYGIWTVHAQTNVPTPFGPYVNRNDLATWLILASPLAASYVMARVSARSAVSGHATISAEELVDSRMAGVAAALCLMLALLLATMSRSGIVGCAAGLLMLLALGRSRVSTGQFLGLLAGLVLAGAIAAAYVSLPMLTERFGSVFADDVGRGRLAIWRQVLPLARDFWRTGVGVGAFERGMLVYEKRPFDLFINQAHDEYLQVFVEGGIPLAALAVFSIVVAWSEARRRLRGDATPAGWLRAGAVSGMTAVAVQSIWDTGLRMPANAVLFAVLGAIAFHERSASPGSMRSADRS